MKENKVWVTKEGMIYVEVEKQIDEKEMLELLEKIKEISKGILLPPKILIVNLVTSSVLRSYRFRKKMGEKLKEIVFERGALYEENIFSRIVALFIVVASEIKNVEVFKTKKKALKWLKES